MTCSWRKIAGAVAYVAFLAIFTEIALQAFYYATAGDFLFRRTSVAIWAPNEYSGIFNRPNLAFHHHTNEFSVWNYTNAEGFRVPAPGREFARNKSEGAYRVILLGPSFAYGWGVDYEQSFAAVLERELESHGFAGSADLELINAGVPSLGVALGLRWYDHVGRTYHPDLVIQFIYGSMAVPNDPTAHAVVSEEGYLVQPDQPRSARLRDRAKKFATVFYAWLVWSKLDAKLEARPEESDRRVLGAGRELEAAARFDPASPQVREALDFYRDLERTVQRDGAELLIVYFPLSYAIHAEDQSRWKHLGVVDVPAQIAFDAEFARYLGERGFQVVNATGALQSAAQRGERLYYWLDIHWTTKGNEVAARAVADWLLGGGARSPTSPGG